jgi:sugar lactone lactonase YvrE
MQNGVKVHKTYQNIKFSTLIASALAASLVVATMVSVIAAATGDTTADLVLGQENLVQGGTNLVDAQGMSSPESAVVDSAGHLFVADASNSRVLGWSSVAALVSGQSADLVIGQPDGLSWLCEAGGAPSAATLCGPRGLALDAAGDLYVADTGNNRVLVYAPPYANADCSSTPCIGAAATMVFGQNGSFTSSTANAGGISASSLSAPAGVAVDSAGNLFISDGSNNRVLEFNTPLDSGSGENGAGDAIADAVFGQGGLFTSNLANNGGVTKSSLSNPQGVALDTSGNLYVADEWNSRVLEYNTPLNPSSSETDPGNADADNVFGQGGLFTQAVADNGGVTAGSLEFPQGVAVDSAGDLFVADSSNNRVLEFNAPLDPPNLLTGAGDAIADAVFGQPDTSTNLCGNGILGNAPLDASGLCFPANVAMDSIGNVYVADAGNDRMLEYHTPFNANSGESDAGNTVADLVLGQVAFGYGSLNLVDARGMNYPRRHRGRRAWPRLYRRRREQSRARMV